jgi:hypothetical protein
MESTEALERVRELLRTLSARESSQLVELVDILNAAGLSDTHKALYNGASMQLFPYAGAGFNAESAGGNATHTHNAACAAGQCPLKMEMNRMDNFYNDLFFDTI